MDIGFQLAFQLLLNQNPRKGINDVISVLIVYNNNLHLVLVS